MFREKQVVKLYNNKINLTDEDYDVIYKYSLEEISHRVCRYFIPQPQRAQWYKRFKFYIVNNFDALLEMLMTSLECYLFKFTDQVNFYPVDHKEPIIMTSNFIEESVNSISWYYIVETQKLELHFKTLRVKNVYTNKYENIDVLVTHEAGEEILFDVLVTTHYKSFDLMSRYSWPGRLDTLEYKRKKYPKKIDIEDLKACKFPVDDSKQIYHFYIKSCGVGVGTFFYHEHLGGNDAKIKNGKKIRFNSNY